MRVFDERGTELSTAELEAEVAVRKAPRRVPIELLAGDGTSILQIAIEVPADRPDVAGVRILRPDTEPKTEATR